MGLPIARQVSYVLLFIAKLSVLRLEGDPPEDFARKFQRDLRKKRTHINPTASNPDKTMIQGLATLDEAFIS